MGFLLAALGILCPPIEADAIEVSPGTLVRWPGEGVDRCGMGDRSWLPLDGECWYAIDLLAAEGSTEVIRWRGEQRDQRQVRVGAYPYEVQYITLKDDSQVQLSAENLRRVQQENQQIATLWSLETARRFALPLGPPLATLPKGGRFGARRFFNNQPRSPHPGADYSADAGTPILAVGAKHQPHVQLIALDQHAQRPGVVDVEADISIENDRDFSRGACAGHGQCGQ